MSGTITVKIILTLKTKTKFICDPLGIFLFHNVRLFQIPKNNLFNYKFPFVIFILLNTQVTSKHVPIIMLALLTVLTTLVLAPKLIPI